MSENPLYKHARIQVSANNATLTFRAIVEVELERSYVEDDLDHPISDEQWQAVARHLAELPYTSNTDRLQDDVSAEVLRFLGEQP